ncbi:MAG: c-type cytochrome, partial [Bradymonadaceae bacterium]
MTKRQTWLFSVIATGLCSAAFIALTIHSHTRFDDLTNSENLTPKVERGMEVWHEYNCINCHTMYGEGAYYAPDLTNIAKQRSDAYLRQFLKNPSKFYAPDDYGRVMPDLGLSDEEIGQLIAFFNWVSKVDTHNWPPRPIRVTGGGLPTTSKATSSGQGPVARGRALFQDPDIACNSCHSTAKGVKKVGPSLAGLPKRAKETIQESDYSGSATTAREYIEESIVDPNAYIVPGKNHASGG